MILVIRSSCLSSSCAFDEVNKEVDDKIFLRNFSLKKVVAENDKADLNVLRLSSAPKGDYTIFIFTQADNARSFFLNPTSSYLFSKQNVYVFQNEDVIPARMFKATDSVYLLSVCSTCGSQCETDNSEVPPWTYSLFAALNRIFIFDFWDYLKKNDFCLPTIVSDDDSVLNIVKYFITHQLEKYRKFLETINNLKRKTSRGRQDKNILIYTVDSDGVFQSLYYDLQQRDKNVFLVNNHTGWIQDAGWSPQDKSFMSDVDFAKYLIERDVGCVIFKNYYDMELVNNEQLSKIWIMKELGITIISFIVDTMIEFPLVRFGFMHWLPENTQIISASSTESYDAFRKWISEEKMPLGAEKIHKCPQVVEFCRNGHNEVQKNKEKPESVIVASSARLFIVKEMPALTLLLVPLVREIIYNRLNIYNAYFCFIEAVAKAEELFGTEDLIPFYYYIERATLTLRSLLRYSLVDAVAKAAKKMDLPFNVFGSEDWGVLFPDAYIPKYLNRDELHQAYQKNIVLIPTPSTTFESQHPSITKVMLLGGRVIAPAPLFGENSAEIMALKRFYFATTDEVGDTLLKLAEDKCVMPREREALLETFGVNCLGNIVQELMEENIKQSSEQVLGAKKATLLMNDTDRGVVSAFSNYILQLFKATSGRSSYGYFLSSVKESCSIFLSQEVEEIMVSRDKYREKLKYENDIQENVLKNIY